MTAYYIFFFIFAFIAFLGLLIFLRKLQYDRTQFNLLDLKKKIGGSVQRNSFLQQPQFRGKFKGYDFQITFSNDKIGNERVSYITYSFVRSFKTQLTIGSQQWFADMGESTDDQKDILVIGDYALRSSSTMLLKKLQADQNFTKLLEDLGSFAYIMFSNAGLMLEVKSAQIIVDIEHENVLKVLNSVDSLSRKL